MQHRCSDFGMDKQQYYGAAGVAGVCHSPALWHGWRRPRHDHTGCAPLRLLLLLGVPPAGDGVVTGSGTVYGRPVFAFSQDFTGKQAPWAATKLVLQAAVRAGVPVLPLRCSFAASASAGAGSCMALVLLLPLTRLPSHPAPRLLRGLQCLAAPSLSRTLQRFAA